MFPEARWVEFVEQAIGRAGSQKALAERWGVHEGTLRGWRDKKASPTLRMMAELRFSPAETICILRLQAGQVATVEPTENLTPILNATPADLIDATSKLATAALSHASLGNRCLLDGKLDPEERAALDLSLDFVKECAGENRPSRFPRLLRALSSLVGRRQSLMALSR